MTKVLFLLTLAFLSSCASGGVVTAGKDTRMRIAVIDSGINVSKEIEPYVCADGHEDVTGKGLKDAMGHGTNVAHIIAKGMDPKKQCLVIVKWIHDYGSRYADGRLDLPYRARHNDDFWTGEIVRLAVASGARLVNMSYGGEMKSKDEEREVRAGIKLGVTFVMAAGNEGRDLGRACTYYPACSFSGDKSVHVVGSTDAAGKKLPTSNYGKPVTDWAVGHEVAGGYSSPEAEKAKRPIKLTGTSQATANVTARLAREAAGK